ncbi:MAG: hypothetical protein SCJ94_00295 [Bacillota bacterium]|nr:hypothetical protein [Bacillota bacterium]MDW7728434.1 hypothetical protein [Bacillota bacterium]
MGSGKIFIRERRKVKDGEKKPRFAIVAVTDVDVKFKIKHIRKMEVEQIADAVGAEVVYLEAGKHNDDLDDEDDD